MLSFPADLQGVHGLVEVQSLHIWKQPGRTITSPINSYAGDGGIGEGGKINLFVPSLKMSSELIPSSFKGTSEDLKFGAIYSG